MLINDSNKIVGCFGLIVNDFNSRQDLWSWLAALYVEESERGQSLGGMMLAHGIAESRRLGFSKLYLATDHIGYYEKYGFTYSGRCYGPDGEPGRLYETDGDAVRRFEYVDDKTETARQDELNEALRSIESTLSKCEKALTKLRVGTSQHTLTIRRIDAFRIAVTLIKEKLGFVYDRDDITPHVNSIRFF